MSKQLHESHLKLLLQAASKLSQIVDACDDESRSPYERLGRIQVLAELSKELVEHVLGGDE